MIIDTRQVGHCPYYCRDERNCTHCFNCGEWNSLEECQDGRCHECGRDMHLEFRSGYER